MAWSLTQQQQHGNFFCSLALFFLSSCFLHLNICICWFNDVKPIAYYKIKRDAKEEEIKKNKCVTRSNQIKATIFLLRSRLVPFFSVPVGPRENQKKILPKILMARPGINIFIVVSFPARHLLSMSP